MSATSSSSSTSGTTNSTAATSQYLSTFKFDMLNVSMFDNNFKQNTAAFNNILGFQDISPLLVPHYKLPPDDPENGALINSTTNNLVAWLNSIPITDPYSKEIHNLTISANAPSPAVTTLKGHVNFKETILHHIKGTAKWFSSQKPAPRGNSERWQDKRSMVQICHMIYLQVIFLGDKSLNPWQLTFYMELSDSMNEYKVCSFCNKLQGSWCKDIVVV